MTSKNFEFKPDYPYWSAVHEPLSDIITTIENKIDRERRDELRARFAGLPIWTLTHVRVARQMWKVVLALATDRKEVGLGLEVGAGVPPLVREVCESIFNVAFVFEDVGTRMPWFWKATWREICKRHDEIGASFGGKPEWDRWLKMLATERDAWEKTLSAEGAPLTTAELANWKEVDWWPNPGKMATLCTSPQRRARLAYFNVRYYGELSGQSHLSAAGMLDQGVAVHPFSGDDAKRVYFAKRVTVGLALMLSLASQLCLDVVPEPPLAQRIINVWQTPGLGDFPAETYSEAFKTDLEALAARLS